MSGTMYIDPGANFGFAFRLPSGRAMYGTEDFGKFNTEPGRAHLEFYKWLDSFLYSATPDLIVSESPIFRGKYSEYLYGFSVIIGMLCQKHGIIARRVNLMTVKASVAGSGRADKNRIMRCMRDLGYHPDTEHEADALAIMVYCERHSGKDGETIIRRTKLKRKKKQTKG